MKSKLALVESSSCIFTDHEVNSGFRQKRKTGSFINHLIASYRKKSSIVSYTFVSDEDLLEMNITHLNHDTYTDIITFDLTEKNSPVVIADIYISVDRVKDNAIQLQIPYQSELLRVILHGALHIAGFGDKTKKDREQMRSLEDSWMRKFFDLP